MPVELRNAQRRFRVDTGRLRRRAEALLAALNRPEAVLSILLTDDRGIAELHERWMAEKGPTDVLSFPMAETQMLGDVVISVETALRRRREDPLREMTRYLIHGLLHLIGHDHVRQGERRRFEREARRLQRIMSEGSK